MRHGAIGRILTDQGRSFCSNFMESFYKMSNCQHVKTTPYHPQTNGMAERLVRIDYVELRDADELSEVSHVSRPVVLAMAAFVGQTRLIDNRVLRDPSSKP